MSSSIRQPSTPSCHRTSPAQLFWSAIVFRAIVQPFVPAPRGDVIGGARGPVGIARDGIARDFVKEVSKCVQPFFEGFVPPFSGASNCQATHASSASV
ncbi:MAG: hypothetical protein ACUVYA_07200 [Planctomycetota bacterium]